MRPLPGDACSSFAGDVLGGAAGGGVGETGPLVAAAESTFWAAKMLPHNGHLTDLPSASSGKRNCRRQLVQLISAFMKSPAIAHRYAAYKVILDVACW